MPSHVLRLHHKLFRKFSSRYNLIWRAGQESEERDAEGYNYRQLWRHHSLFIQETGSICIAISK